jgi:hypothetical protein
MTTATCYPGVCVTEVPGGDRMIAGLATSVAAVAGLARRGPVDAATLVSGFLDRQPSSGGLCGGSTVSFAVAPSSSTAAARP